LNPTAALFNKSPTAPFEVRIKSVLPFDQIRTRLKNVIKSHPASCIPVFNRSGASRSNSLLSRVESSAAGFEFAGLSFKAVSKSNLQIQQKFAYFEKEIREF
jgi:hypothetical protein